MAKIVSVYINDSEVEMLETLKGVLGIQEESRIFKTALKHLGNDHIHGETAPDRLASELAIEVPAVVRLRAMVKECLKEVKEEPEKQRREYADRFWKKLREGG